MIGTFALFDAVNFATPWRRILPPLVMVVVAAVITPWPAFGVGAAAIVMSLLAPNPFAADERGRLDTLYATLPITRRTVVAGRYLALVLLHLAVSLVATLAAVVVSAVKGEPLAPATLGVVFIAGVVVFACALAVQMPFFFSVGFTRARPMMYVPVAVLAGGGWLAGRTGLADHVDLAALTSLNPAALWAPSLVIAAVALAASAAVSSARYARRAL